jgi:dehydrogenase/reductase SDR family member 7B
LARGLQWSPCMNSYNGKNVWITGASSGIGAALALELSARGANLVLSARNEDALREVAARCTGSGRVAIVPMDLADADRVAATAAEVWAAHGPVDVVVHNAGVALRELAERTSAAVDRQIFEVNYFGPVALTRALLPRMLARGAGRFVVVSSMSGKFGVPMLSAYSAAKHALHGWFDSLRAEVSGRGIEITIAVPGFIATDLTRNALKGDGACFGRQLAVQAAGMPVERCAVALADGVAAGRDEFCVGRAAVLSTLLNRLAPSLWSWIIRNHPVRFWRNLVQSLRLARQPTIG